MPQSAQTLLWCRNALAGGGAGILFHQVAIDIVDLRVEGALEAATVIGDLSGSLQREDADGGSCSIEVPADVVERDRVAISLRIHAHANVADRGVLVGEFELRSVGMIVLER